MNTAHAREAASPSASSSCQRPPGVRCQMSSHGSIPAVAEPARDPLDHRLVPPVVRQEDVERPRHVAGLRLRLAQLVPHRRPPAT